MATDRDIYEAVGGELVRLATVIVGPDEASDVVSRVVARRLARGPLSDLRDARQYLMRAVINEAKNVHRSRNRSMVALQRLGTPDVVDDPAQGRFPDVTQQVMELPDRQRAAVFLVYWMGLSTSEAAAVLGCRPSTARRYLSVAKGKLRKAFDER